MRTLFRSGCVGLGLIISLASFSGCAMKELKNSNRRLREANEDLVGENNRLQRELANAHTQLGARNSELAELRDSLNNAPATRDEFRELGLETGRTAQGTWVRLDQSILFSLGQAKLSTSGRRILGRVASLLNGKYGRQVIRVEGHTDDIPVRKVRNKYPSNWELSTARACSVVRYLVDQGRVDPHRIYPAGYSYFRPRAAGKNSNSRRKNRRVEILILNERV